jgi:hypothetical protein
MRRAIGEGLPVTVHYLAATEAGVVERIEDEGRTVVVVTETDDVLRFHLTASARFSTSDLSAWLGPAAEA